MKAKMETTPKQWCPQKWRPTKNKDGPKIAEGPKNEHDPKEGKGKKGNLKIEDSSKVKTYSWCHSICDFSPWLSQQEWPWPVMMFIVETGNRNPHVKKHDLRQSAKIKDNIWNAKSTNVELYIKYYLDFKNMNKSKKSNLLFDFEC